MPRRPFVACLAAWATLALVAKATSAFAADPPALASAGAAADVNPMTGQPEQLDALRARLANLQLQTRIENELTGIARARQERRRLSGADDSDDAPASTGARGARVPARAARDAAGTAAGKAPGAAAVLGGAAPGSAAPGAAADRARPPRSPDALAGAPAAGDEDGQTAPAVRLVGVLDDGSVPRAGGKLVALVDVDGRMHALGEGGRVGAVQVERVVADAALINGRWLRLPQAIGRLPPLRTPDEVAPARAGASPANPGSVPLRPESLLPGAAPLPLPNGALR